METNDGIRRISLKKRNAERVFYFVNNENKEDLVIRSGWSLSEQNIQAITQTGINKIPVDNKD